MDIGREVTVEMVVEVYHIHRPTRLSVERRKFLGGANPAENADLYAIFCSILVAFECIFEAGRKG